MAEVALNWTATRPGVASVVIGATTLPQLRANLRALDFEIPKELRQRLDEVSAPPRPYPYTFFEERVQNDMTGGVQVRKPGSAANESGENR
jgi:diketogulonate reductase-like aldo/keto reductase